MFGNLEPQKEERKYTTKIESPIYEPKNQKPHILELYDNQKTRRLIREIDQSSLPTEEKMFLVDAARRHTIFNYEKIADYYANASQEMQSLMEKSALVIIDFEKAIEYGYVKMCDDIRTQYLEEYGD
jgi:hypothetical protein